MSKVMGLFAYAGGKTCILNHLDNIFSSIHYDRFYDLFGGSGAITMGLDYSCAHRYINDIDESIAILYIAVSDRNILCRFIDEVTKLTAIDEDFQNARIQWYSYMDTQPKVSLFELAKTNIDYFVKLASAVYLLHSCYYAGVIKRCNVTLTDDLMHRFEQRKSLKLIEWYEKRMDGVYISNCDTEIIIDEMLLNPNYNDVSLLYLDVPYLTANTSAVITGTTYKFGMPVDKHLNLLNKLNQLPHENYKIIISNFSNDTYDEFIYDMNWHKKYIADRAMQSDNTGGVRAKGRVQEFIYANFPV